MGSLVGLEARQRKFYKQKDSYFDKVNRFLDLLLLGVTAFCHNFAAQHGGETDE